MASIHDLPAEIHVTIISLVERLLDMVAVKRVCKNYYKVVNGINFMDKIKGINWDPGKIRNFQVKSNYCIRHLI
jgi:hypothetical protein